MVYFTLSLVTLSALLIAPCEGVKQNVLMLVVDDLRPELGIYEAYSKTSELYSGINTTNINNLAAKSTVFLNAYVQVAICGPSRTSFLTSRRPDSTGIYLNAKAGTYRVETLPQHFKENGYETNSLGKIFHRASDIDDDLKAWDQANIYYPSKSSIIWGQTGNAIVYASKSETDATPLPDTAIADKAIQKLRRRSRTEPFFLAVGFLKPHLPFFCRDHIQEHYKKIENQHPITIANYPNRPLDFPRKSWTRSTEFKSFMDIAATGFSGGFDETLVDAKAKEARLAYYCAVTHIDEEIGRVLAELKRLKLDDSTVIMLLSDHGWQLGEHGQWGKSTTFALSTRSVLMIHDPQLTNQAKTIEEIVEFVDIMPTLSEVAGLGTIPTCPEDNPNDVALCTHGTSLKPLLSANDGGSGLGLAFSQNFFPSSTAPSMEYGVLSSDFHYIRHVEVDVNTGVPDWDAVLGEQFYDLRTDRYENTNQHNEVNTLEFENCNYALLRLEFRKGEASLGDNFCIKLGMYSFLCVLEYDDFCKGLIPT